MKIHLQEDIERHKCEEFENIIYNFDMNEFSRLTLANLFYSHATPYLNNRDKIIYLNSEIGNLIRIITEIEILFLPNEKNKILKINDEKFYLEQNDDNHEWLNIKNIIIDTIKDSSSRIPGTIDCILLYNKLIKPLINLLKEIVEPEKLELYHEERILIEEPYNQHYLFGFIKNIFDFYKKICSYGEVPSTYLFKRTLSNYNKAQLNQFHHKSIIENRNFLRLHLYYINKVENIELNSEQYLYDQGFDIYEYMNDLDININLEQMLEKIKNRLQQQSIKTAQLD